MATSPLQSEKKRQDAAYARAQDAIATARASGASDLTLSGDDFSDLAVLPPDIGSLTALSGLDLMDTQVSDISALSGLNALRFLDLSGTQVSDISALSGLTALTDLDLRGTQVSDISALSGLTALIHLELSDTLVSDLSPILPLTQLADAPELGGLAFRNTAAALVDPRIAEIAEI